MKQQTQPAPYAETIRSTGAQEVPALKKSGKGAVKGKAVRGEDLRNGK